MHFALLMQRWVNALNAAGPDPLQSVCDWIDELARLAPPGLVGEIHLAGFSAQQSLIIDDHSSPVSAPVWQAYAHALEKIDPASTLIEWDEQLPALSVLLGEAAQAAALGDPAQRRLQQRAGQHLRPHEYAATARGADI